MVKLCTSLEKSIELFPSTGVYRVANEHLVFGIILAIKWVRHIRKKVLQGEAQLPSFNRLQQLPFANNPWVFRKDFSRNWNTPEPET